MLLVDKFACLFDTFWQYFLDKLCCLLSASLYFSHSSTTFRT